MITPRDVQPLVASPEFQRLLKASEADPASRAYRCLKGLERLSRGVTGKEDKHYTLVRRNTSTAPGHALRQSRKETVDGRSEHLSV